MLTIVILAAPRHKSLLIGGVVFFLWLVNSWNFLFILGLWMAHLSTTGFFQRFENWFFRIALAAVGFACMSRDMKLQVYLERVQEIQFLPPLNNGLSMSAFCFLFLFEITPLLQRIGSMKPFVFLGKISFGLYLAHPFVLQWLLPPFIQAFSKSGMSFQAMVGCCFILYVPSCLLVGYLFHIAFDIPSINIARNLYTLVFDRTYTWK